MSSTNVALLGAIAGFTICLGLPIGRLRTPTPRLKTGLNAAAIGILVFLVRDALAHAGEPVDEALGKHDWSTVASGGITLAAGLAIGLAGLVHYDAWIAGRRATAAARPAGPGAGERPSWVTLLWLGLIGGPTFIDTLVGQHLVNDTLSIAFLGLAAGSTLYVVIRWAVPPAGAVVSVLVVVTGFLLPVPALSPDSGRARGQVRCMDSRPVP
ncbi:hypothetical protein [Streptomyces sp. NBC_01601]|uniref:hypothetical protein n=1 Tax=Streptomyces sp. NBC_01601 TaxID=2975892 RepID=UPI002E2AD248|nr:hypothetical protein [Streptomyces sp. NBC_01601]